jgi:hypothetical protein
MSTVYDYVNDEERTNKHGNKVCDGFLLNGERYEFDFGPCSGGGWIQYDTKQDAPYFGIWVNVEERLVFTFAEGDTSLVTCPTVESFRAELASMQEFYGDPPPMAIVFSEDGTRTEYYDENARPVV